MEQHHVHCQSASSAMGNLQSVVPLNSNPVYKIADVFLTDVKIEALERDLCRHPCTVPTSPQTSRPHPETRLIQGNHLLSTLQEPKQALRPQVTTFINTKPYCNTERACKRTMPGNRPNDTPPSPLSPTASFYDMSDDEEGDYSTIRHSKSGKGVKLLYSKSKVCSQHESITTKPTER